MLKEKYAKGKWLDNPLMDVFGFDAQDLQNNQQGFISQEQIMSLKWRLFRKTLVTLGGLFLAGTWTFLFAFLVQHTFTSDKTGLWDKVFTSGGFIFALSMALYTFYVLVEMWRQNMHDIRVGVVERISGTIVKHQLTRHKEGTEYWIIIQGQRFEIWHTQAEKLLDKQPYHLYITPKSRRILSLEQASSEYRDVE